MDDNIDEARMNDPQIREALAKRVRITQADLKKYGYPGRSAALRLPNL